MSVRQVRWYLPLTVIVLLLVASSVLNAQGYDPNGNPKEENEYTNHREDKGPTATLLVSGTSTSIAGMVKFDGNIGWNFTHHFGIDIGIPYLFDTRPGIFAGTAGRLGYVSEPYYGCSYFFGCYVGEATSSRIWAGELGDPYAEAHYTLNYHRYNMLTNLTADVPVASYSKGLTTGRVQGDWFNHVDTNLHGFDPFVNFGLANGRMDQHFLPRPFNTNLPFRTYGFLADVEGGVQYKAWRTVTIGVSYWGVLPMGPQRIFSNLVWEQPDQSVVFLGDRGVTAQSQFGGTSSTPARGPNGTTTQTITTNTAPNANPVPGDFGFLSGDPNHGRYWNSAFETRGPAYIARDNGYSATLGFSPFRQMDVMVGYNRSVRYALDQVQFTLQFNLNSVFRKMTNY